MRWWQVLLVIGGTVLTLAGVAALTFVLMMHRAVESMDEDWGVDSLDAAEAAEAMQEREVTIPEGFSFVYMSVLLQRTGADQYDGAFGTKLDFAAAQRALQTANPGFPAFRPATCDDEIMDADFATLTGSSCDPLLQLAVTTRAVGGAATLADNYHGTPPDSETLMLTRDGDLVKLYVLSRGH